MVCRSKGEEMFSDLHAGPSFVDTLTKLLEMVAHVVDQQDSQVRDHYGNGRMLHVLRHLQAETDFHAIKLLDTFAEKRALSRKVLSRCNNVSHLDNAVA